MLKITSARKKKIKKLKASHFKSFSPYLFERNGGGTVAAFS